MIIIDNIVPVIDALIGVSHWRRVYVELYFSVAV